jgi:UDP-N-acetylglucosamine 2-epimerase (non-hydrolysing)
MPQKPTLLLVAGARPNFMKIAPILRTARDRGLQAVLVHTGQHYDAVMSDAFFTDLGIPVPDFYLGVGSGSHAQQTARVMEAFEPVLASARPDWVTVVGDINSTLACALVAAKLRHELGLRIAHVEAGLRSRDWTMPEEINRVLTDRLSDLLLTPSPDAAVNLMAEGIPASRIVFAGNVMIDTLQAMLPAARALNAPAALGVADRPYVVCTLHRPSNVDAPGPLRVILAALGALAKECDVVFPIHPRTRERVRLFGLEPMLAPLRTTEPLGYLTMVGLQEAAALVITDSGGIQEETTVLGVPCVTIRESTERPITITEGTNRLAPWPPAVETLLPALRAALARGRSGTARVPAGWDGRASERIVDALVAFTERPPLGVEDAGAVTSGRARIA